MSHAAWPGAMWPSGMYSVSSSISSSTECRWLKVARRESCPLRRTGIPSFPKLGLTRLAKASASAMP